MTSTSTATAAPLVLTLGLSHIESVDVQEVAISLNALTESFDVIDDLITACHDVSVGCVIASERSLTTTGFSRLRSSAPQLTIVALQRSTSAGRAVELMQNGTVSVVMSPLNQSDLMKATVNAIRKSEHRNQLAGFCLEATSRMARATRKEIEVLHLILQGKKNKEIAFALDITVRAVEDRRFRLMKKVGVDSLAELVELAVIAKLSECGLTTGQARRTELSQQSSCVVATEVWVPNVDGRLILGSSFYADNTIEDAANAGAEYRRKSGLPAQALRQQTAAFCDRMGSQEFDAADLPVSGSSPAAVAFPVFEKQHVRAVVLLMLSTEDLTVAAAELWQLDADPPHRKSEQGIYLNCQRLKQLTACMHLPADHGLIEQSQQTGAPQMAGQLAQNPLMVRGAAMGAEGLISAIALPLSKATTTGDQTLLLLNSLARPLFSVMQTWKTTDLQAVLEEELVNGVLSPATHLTEASRSDKSLVNRCVQTRTPHVVSGEEAAEVYCTPGTPEVSFAIAIPSIVEGRVIAVSVLAAIS